MTKKILITLGCVTLLPLLGWSQVENLDKIVGRVGNNIILKSDVEILLNQQKRNDETKKNVSECDVLYEIMMQQIMVAQADRDSVIVSDQEVDQRVTERINQMINRAGGNKELVEREAGRSIYQIKEENKKFFKDEMTANQMQQKLITDIKVTPFEVEKYFNSLPQDSLPAIPASVMIGQLTFAPKASDEMEEYARERMVNIRKDIVEGGKSFSLMAGLYGMDQTKNSGGEMIMEKDRVDPTFAAAAMRLQPGEISPVFRSKFGYHIIEMIQKTSNNVAKVKHIIIIPEITNSEFNKTKALADSVYQLLQSGKMTFAKAFATFSTDDFLKMSGGYIANEYTQSTSLEMSDLDPYLVQNLDKIPVGGYSEPHLFTDRYGQRVMRIAYLKEKTDPHVYNLKDDYNLVQSQALLMKQSNHLKSFVNKNIYNFYVEVDPAFKSCPSIQPWISVINK